MSRTMVMARAVQDSGARAEVYVARQVAVDLGEVRVSVVPFTQAQLGPSLAEAGDDVVVMLDLPDEAVAPLAWLVDVPVFRAAFRMFGPVGSSVEHVSITAAYRPDEIEHDERLPLVRLAGWSGIVIRPGLFDARQHGTETTSVLITMGGSDPHDLTSRACAALAGFGDRSDIVVAVGAGNPRFDDLASAYGSVMTIVRPTAGEFDSLLKTATVAVINGGLTRYECIAAGTPFVALAIHERQAAITREVTSRGFGLDLGPFDRVRPDDLRSAVERLLTDTALRNEMIATSHAHVRQDAPARLVAWVNGLRSTLPWRAA